MTVTEVFSLTILCCFLALGLYAFIASWYHDHPQDSHTLRRHKRRRRHHPRFYGVRNGSRDE